MDQNLSKEAFSKNVNSIFQLSNETIGTIEAELISLSDHRCAPGHEAFSLIFKAPAETRTMQGIYRACNSEMGTFDIFLVPIRTDAKGFYLEAVFNRQAERST